MKVFVVSSRAKGCTTTDIVGAYSSKEKAIEGASNDAKNNGYCAPSFEDEEFESVTYAELYDGRVDYNNVLYYEIKAVELDNAA